MDYIKISELDEASNFGTQDHFVLVQSDQTLKISATDMVNSFTTLTNLATRSFVTAIVDSAPETLDTLKELAAALNDDANFASTITNLIASKLDTSSFGLKFWEELEQVNTYHIAEGSNLYWTQERFDTALAAKNTYHLEEGSNLYFTEQRVLDVVTPLIPTSIFDLGVPDVAIPESIPGYLYYDGTELSWQAVEGFSGDYRDLTNKPTDPIFTSVTATQLNVQNVAFTGVGAVTIESGNDLNFVAAGDIRFNGNKLATVATSGSYADLTNKPTLFQIGIKEPITGLTSATGVVNHNMATANIFNHSSLAGNFTCNLINLSLPTNNAINVTLIINQGATPYMPTAFQIGGVAQTINWLNGVAPAGSASKIDVASFSILNNSGTYTVLGSLSTFG